MSKYHVMMRRMRSELLRTGRRRDTAVSCVLLVCAITCMACLISTASVTTNRHDRSFIKPRRLPSPLRSEKQAMEDLFWLLTPPSDGEKICKRLVRIGGEAVMLGSTSAVICGDHVVCVDPELQMATGQCTVVSLTACNDRTFSTAASRFGCDVFQLPECPVQKGHNSTTAELQDHHRQNLPQLHHAQEMSWRMEHSGKTVSFLAIASRSDLLFNMIEHMPKSLLSRTEQIGVVFNLTDGLDRLRLRPSRQYWLESTFGVRLYKAILTMQTAGFVLYDVESVRTLESVSIQLPGRGSIDSILRTSWIKLAPS